MHRAGAIPALENHSLLIKVRITSSLVLFIICCSHILFFSLRWNTKSDKMLQLAEETRGFIAHFGSSPGRWRNLFCACESLGGEAAIPSFLARTIPRATQAIWEHTLHHTTVNLPDIQATKGLITFFLAWAPKVLETFRASFRASFRAWNQIFKWKFREKRGYYLTNQSILFL